MYHFTNVLYVPSHLQTFTDLMYLRSKVSFMMFDDWQKKPCKKLVANSCPLKEVNLGGKSLCAKCLGGTFKITQGVVTCMVKILLQVIVSIYNCSNNLSFSKMFLIFLAKMCHCTRFRREMRCSCNPHLNANTGPQFAESIKRHLKIMIDPFQFHLS